MSFPIWGEVSTSSYLGGVDLYSGGVFSFGGCFNVSVCHLHFRATVLDEFEMLFMNRLNVHSTRNKKSATLSRLVPGWMDIDQRDSPWPVAWISRTISAVSSLLCGLMSHNTTVAPRRANSMAKSLPKPLPPPVIIHTWPLTFFSFGRTIHLAPANTKAHTTLHVTKQNSTKTFIVG